MSVNGYRYSCLKRFNLAVTEKASGTPPCIQIAARRIALDL